MKRENVENIIIFANAFNKIKYNIVHETINIKIDDKVYLRLHQNYIITKLINHKLLHQRVDFFEVFKRIEKLTFRLRLSFVIKIHSIINVTQLKSKSSKTNSYNRSINSELSSIIEIDFETFFYTLKRILNKRISRGQVYYLMK